MLGVAIIAGVLIGGCRAADHRREADQVAYDIISQKQAEALGHTEPFTIESPADTIRRRLLLDPAPAICHRRVSECQRC